MTLALGPRPPQPVYTTSGATQDPWKAIRDFEIDEGSPKLTFEARLARENRWSRDFAQRVIEEYKKFLYLAATEGHAVTPSDQIEQAWRLHLSYTRSYWDRLCGQVLQRPLHFRPAMGDSGEIARLQESYSRTLASYRAAFHQEPSEDLWPSAARRFEHDAHAVRVNALDHWVIPKWRVRKLGVLSGLGAVLLSGLAMA